MAKGGKSGGAKTGKPAKLPFPGARPPFKAPAKKGGKGGKK